MSNHIPTWPARAGIPGFLLWLSVVIGIVGIGGFVYVLIS